MFVPGLALALHATALAQHVGGLVFGDRPGGLSIVTVECLAWTGLVGGFLLALCGFWFLVATFRQWPSDAVLDGEGVRIDGGLGLFAAGAPPAVHAWSELDAAKVTLEDVKVERLTLPLIVL